MMKVSVADYYNSVAETYFQQYQRANLSSHGIYPANYFRLQIFVQRLAELRLKSVYEVGVGEGTPLATMAAMGFRVAGCDIAELMVAKAKANFKSRGLSDEAVRWADIQDATTFAVQLADGAFDAVIAAGVLPHIANDRLALKNMATLIRDGGRLFVEFRNKLFSLFTFNRYTKEFIIDDLLSGVPADVKARVAQELDRRLAVNLPPPRTLASDGSSPGYDAILSKFHNPFELTEVVERCGFKDVRIHWYHYHPAPPLLEETIGPAFRSAAMALEHEGSWRGNFLCSAGVIEAIKDA
jgi:2-polyprenyl-3-methyl-5-hydroxy-6-metoxy-1,4-benzoquinol methylase